MSPRVEYVTRLGPRHKFRETYRGPSLDEARAAMSCGACACLGAEVVMVGTRANLRANGAFTALSGLTIVDVRFAGYMRCEVKS